MEIFAPLGRARSLENTRNGPKLMYPDWQALLVHAAIHIAQSYDLQGNINEIADQITILDSRPVFEYDLDHYFEGYVTREGDFESWTPPIIYIWMAEFQYSEDGSSCVLGLTNNMEWYTWMD